MQFVPGVTLVRATEHRDDRGSLIALEQEQGLPFNPQRLFYMYDCPTDEQRGEHATSCYLAIVAVAGGVTVDVDSGLGTGSYRLTHPDQVLCIHAGVWLRLRDFAPSTVLVVAASASYAETEYFDTPQPHLLNSLEKVA